MPNHSTAEHQRLEEARTRARSGAAGGPTSPSGSGAPSARTTRPTATRGTTFPSITRTCARTAGGRTACSASATTAAWCASRSRSGTARIRILKERLFGSERQGGQPRRGRERALLVPRRDAHRLLREGALQVPAARLPLRRAPRARAQAAGKLDPEPEILDTGVFDDDRYFDVQVEYAKGDPRRRARARHGARTADRRRRRSSSCRSSGFATRGAGSAEAPAARSCTRANRSDGVQVVETVQEHLGRFWLYAEGARGASLHGERVERERPLAGAPNRAAAREGRVPRGHRPRAQRRA